MALFQARIEERSRTGVTDIEDETLVEIPGRISR